MHNLNTQSKIITFKFKSIMYLSNVVSDGHLRKLGNIIVRAINKSVQQYPMITAEVLRAVVAGCRDIVDVSTIRAGLDYALPSRKMH